MRTVNLALEAFRPSPGRAQGFSLIELMIALVAGLLVALAAVAFITSSLKSNSEFVRATRLEQELRSNLDFVTRDVRRAGYDQNALKYVNQPIASVTYSPFNKIQIISANASRSCIVYAYDRQPGVAGTVELANKEIRAIRRMPSALTVNGVQVGVLEFSQSDTGRTPSCDDSVVGVNGGADYSTYPATCTSDANTASGVAKWCPLSDSRTLNVTSFFVDPGANVCIPAATCSGTSTMQVRDLRITLSGNLLNATDVARQVRSSVRVRADCVRAAAGTGCIAAPTGT